MERKNIIVTVCVLVVVGVLCFFFVKQARENPAGTETTNYSSVLYVGNRAIPCIAEVSKDTDFYEDGRGRAHWYSDYRLVSLRLPEGITVDCDEDIDFEEAADVYRIMLDDIWSDCSLLVGREASAKAESMILNASISPHGRIWVERASGQVHLYDCSAVRGLVSSEVIKFDNDTEALVCGFSEWCNTCNERLDSLGWDIEALYE